MDEYLNNCEISYGFAYSWGWSGIGAIYYDLTGTAIWFKDDIVCMTKDEIIYNELMRMNILEFMGIL